MLLSNSVTRYSTKCLIKNICSVNNHVYLNYFNKISRISRYYTTATLGKPIERQEEEEEQSLISDKPLFTKDMVYRHYENNHVPLSQAKFRPYGANNTFTNTEELEKYQVSRSYTPVDLTDKVALGIMKFLRVFVHGFFGNRYLHHAVGMEITKPTLLERLLVVGAQVGFTSFYSMAYLINPRFCHRLVGYLEEEAVGAYSEFLKAIDNGSIPNIKAPEIAIKYWNLKPEATMRDVVLVIRADECMHRDYNHDMSDFHRAGVKV